MGNFSDFIINEQDAKDKQKQIANVIEAAVKKNMTEKVETDDAIIIKFEVPGRRRASQYQVAICVDYMKKVYRGNYLVVFINIVKEDLNNRMSDNIVVDVARVSATEFSTTLLSIKDYFTKLLNNPLVQDSKK